jgi:hypothetical protein
MDIKINKKETYKEIEKDKERKKRRNMGMEKYSRKEENIQEYN